MTEFTGHPLAPSASSMCSLHPAIPSPLGGDSEISGQAYLNIDQRRRQTFARSYGEAELHGCAALLGARALGRR